MDNGSHVEVVISGTYRFTMDLPSIQGAALIEGKKDTFVHILCQGHKKARARL